MRGSRNYPEVYFGRPGNLVKLPYPRGGVDRPYERTVYDFASGNGQHIVSSMVNGSRPYGLRWNGLHVDNYKLLEQFWTGSMGAGPWVLIDPAMTNMLRINQSSATNAFNDARHWSADNGTLSSNLVATHVHRSGALRSLRWFWSGAASLIPVLTTTPPYRSWYGFPVVPGQSYAFSSWIKPDGVVDTSITVGLRLQWVNATGGTISEASGGNIATTGWLRHSVVGVAPANAVYVKPLWVVTGSTVSAGGSLYIDEPLLEQDTVVNDWAPGTGLRPVEILGLTDAVPFDTRFRTPIEMSLRELIA